MSELVAREAVEYIPRTRDLYATKEPYRWVHNDAPPPLAPIKQGLSEAAVALVSSSGMFVGGDQQPFGLADDSSIREIPADIDVRMLWPAHFGYRTARAEEDPNTVFPIERLHELAKRNAIGAVAPHAVTFMGGIYSHRRSRQELAPEVVNSVARANPDIALLVPV